MLHSTKHFPRILFAALLVACNAPTCFADDPLSVTIASEVTTKGTDFDGERYSKTSDWTKFTVPTGFVFNKDTLVKSYTSKNGSSNRIDHKWSDYVEIVEGTGIKMPRTLQIRTHARSPKSDYPGHNHNARGWSKAKVTAKYVKYK